MHQQSTAAKHQNTHSPQPILDQERAEGREDREPTRAVLLFKTANLGTGHRTMFTRPFSYVCFLNVILILLTLYLAPLLDRHLLFDFVFVSSVSCLKDAYLYIFIYIHTHTHTKLTTSCCFYCRIAWKYGHPMTSRPL